MTHVFLGAAIAQALAGQRIGFRRAFLLGGLAATIPDFDVLLHTGDMMRDHALHRSFMHALILVPALALLALLPFLKSKSARPMAGRMYLAALLASASHTLLDSLTSYGTMIFWPFSARRYALDVIAVIDPAFTLPLIVGTLLAWRWRVRPRQPARIAAAVFAMSCLYLGLATWQHARAADAQRRLMASRGVVLAENPRVLPQVGAIISYRSIYIQDGVIQADALRVPLLGAPVVKAGSTVPQLSVADLKQPAIPEAARDFAIFEDLADGYVARSPRDPLLIADLRYTYQPESLDPVWGVQLEETDHAIFRMTPR